MVHLFLEQADKLGLETPLDYQALAAHQPTIDALARNVSDAAALPFPEPAYLPSVAMAQHYGVPTRLLDWSESPLVAAYFAVAKVSKALADYDAAADERVGIYVLDTSDFYREPLKARIAVASAPRHANQNLRAQRGVFIHLKQANLRFMETGDWPSLEDVLDSASADRHLNVLTLPTTAADELLRLLRRYEITRHHLMPNLYNAADAFSYHMALG